MKPAFQVPGGSTGDAHAITQQFEMIASAMAGSKIGDSIAEIASQRSGWCGGMQPSDCSW